MKPIILIKLGGSSITNKDIPYKIRSIAIRKFARQLKRVLRKNTLIVSHGSGSFAHTSASKFGGMKGYKDKLGIAKVSADAARINQIVTDIFVEEGLPAVSLSPMSMMTARKGRLSNNFFEVLEEVIKQSLVPVVYGDVIWDKDWKSTIFSGERTISEIANYLLSKKYKILKVIQISETNGVYDLKGKTIEKIDSSNFSKIGKIFTNNGKIDVTGGMKHKVETAYALAKRGIHTTIISGQGQNELFKAILNKKVKGTLISI